MILLNDFRRQWEDTKTEILDAVSCVGESGWFLLGEQIQAFETTLAERWGLRHAVGVASGLDAIEIGLRVLGCRPGDKVLTTPLSAFATTLAVVKLGAVPVFVDTDEYGLIDLDLCEQALRHSGIRFFLPVHLYGHALDLVRLAEIRDRFGCAIVEDCAQSILATFAGLPTGSAGDLAATSFYPTKNLGAMGDSGAVLTNHEEHLAAVRSLRDYGQTRKYQHDTIGYNSRMEELHAAILQRVFLPRLARWTERRKQIANRYLTTIIHPAIRMMGAPRQSESVWHLFPVLVNQTRRSEFMRYLASRGITSGEHYPILIPDQKALQSESCEMLGSCVRAKAIASSEVSLPIHPYLTDEEVDRVIEACNRWET